ncbi:MAG: PilZ domain-containing protein [Candidatus Omnitrophica bacterium]|nr:PilZ domain-containing protein [Candidatus Omnitrophota bacterium]
MGYFSKPIHDGVKEGERRMARRMQASEDFFIEIRRGRIFKQSLIGYGQDISTEGIRFLTFKKLKKKARLDLHLYFSPQFPGARSVRIPAAIRRVVKPKGSKLYGVGCSFLSKHKQHSNELETIRQFVWWYELHRLPVEREVALSAV